METSVLLRPTVLTAAIRREILSALAASDSMTLSAATAQTAAGWSARRQRRGDSPSSVRTAEAIVFQVGADLLLDDVAARPSEEMPVALSSAAGRQVPCSAEEA
jgi:hypothetical protein